MYLGDWLKTVQDEFTANLVEKLVVETIDLEKPLIKDLIGEQWERGENKDGDAVGLYTPYTEIIAIIENTIMPKIAGEPYNLLWTGSMFNQMIIDYEDFGLNITSESDTKDKIIARIAGNDFVQEPHSIFGLNNENLKTLYIVLNSDLIEGIMRKLRML